MAAPAVTLPPPGFQFNFTVRKRLAREDGDEHLFDFHSILVRANGAIDDSLSEVASQSYGKEQAIDPSLKGILASLDSLGVGQAFETARTHLQSQIKLWDWDEEVDLIGVAKVVFLPVDGRSQ